MARKEIHQKFHDYRIAKDKVRELLSMLSSSVEDKQGEIIRSLLPYLDREVKLLCVK